MRLVHHAWCAAMNEQPWSDGYMPSRRYWEGCAACKKSDSILSVHPEQFSLHTIGSLRRLRFRGSSKWAPGYTLTKWNDILDLTQVRVLDIKHCKMQKGVLDEIRRMSWLTELDIRDTAVRPVDCAEMRGLEVLRADRANELDLLPFKALRTLHLDHSTPSVHTHIKLTGRSLVGLTELVHIKIRFVKHWRAWGTLFAPCTKLKTLDLYHSENFRDGDLRHVHAGLKELCIAGCWAINGNGIRHLTALEQLELGPMNHVNDVLRPLTTLRTLTLYREIYGLTIDGFAPLVHLQRVLHVAADSFRTVAAVQDWQANRLAQTSAALLRDRVAKRQKLQ